MTYLYPPRLSHKIVVFCVALTFFGVNSEVFADETLRITTPEQLVKMQEGAEKEALLVLDVRTKAEFARGFVPGAVNIPLDQVEVELLELRKYREKPVIVYCEAGVRAKRAIRLLEKKGFKDLRHLKGDMGDWRDSGLPIGKPDAFR